MSRSSPDEGGWETLGEKFPQGFPGVVSSSVRLPAGYCWLVLLVLRGKDEAVGEVAVPIRL